MNYCKKCKYRETDQLGDVFCKNEKSPEYNQFVEDENKPCEFREEMKK